MRSRPRQHRDSFRVRVLAVLLLVSVSGCVAPPTATDVQPFVKDYQNERLSGIRRLSLRTFTVSTVETNSGFFEKGHEIDIAKNGEDWTVKRRRFVRRD